MQVYQAEEIAKQTLIPFRDRAEFAALTDILNRKNCHHVIFHSTFSPLMAIAYLQAFLFYLSSKATYARSYQPELIYISRDMLSSDWENHHLTLLQQKLNETDEQKRIIVCENINALNSKRNFYHIFNNLYHHPHCRLLILNDNEAQRCENWGEFYYFKPLLPSYYDYMELIKHYSKTLETYHQVSIPDSLFPHAFYLARRYLPADDHLKNTLLLLDSGSARIKLHLREHSETDKYTLNMAVLNDVISCSTNIPASHLLRHYFNVNDFIHAVQQEVNGQDDAIATAARHIHHAFANLEAKRGPLLNLLFVGCQYSGKKTLAVALVKHLFEQTNVMIIAHKPTHDSKSLMDLKCYQYGEKSETSLKFLIRQMPYAVIFIENIDQMPKYIENNLQEIFMTGYLNEDNEQHDFHQAVIILTTKTGESYLAKLAQSTFTQQETNQPISLMQYVENEHQQQFSLGNDCEEMKKDILAKFSFCQYTNIVPFIPLSKDAIEKIVTNKLKSTIQQLELNYKIELSYAPEIIHYLTEETIRHRDLETGRVDIDQTFKSVYQAIEKAVFNRHIPKTLFLQLNETGQMLRCA